MVLFSSSVSTTVEFFVISNFFCVDSDAVHSIGRLIALLVCALIVVDLVNVASIV